jgi:hypothetical protein
MTEMSQVGDIRRGRDYGAWLGCAMAQAVSRRPLTAAAWVHAQVNPVGCVVDKVALEQVFLRVLQFSRHHSTVGSTFPKIKKKFFHSFAPSLILIWG